MGISCKTPRSKILHPLYSWHWPWSYTIHIVPEIKHNSNTPIPACTFLNVLIPMLKSQGIIKKPCNPMTQLAPYYYEMPYWLNMFRKGMFGISLGPISLSKVQYTTLRELKKLIMCKFECFTIPCVPSTTKVNVPNFVTWLNQLPIFVWCMVARASKLETRKTLV